MGAAASVPHLVIHSLDVGDVHVVSGGTNIFILLTREYVDANQVHLRTQTHTQRVNNVLSNGRAKRALQLPAIL